MDFIIDKSIDIPAMKFYHFDNFLDFEVNYILINFYFWLYLNFNLFIHIIIIIPNYNLLNKHFN
jgi:hypothetical protein